MSAWESSSGVNLATDTLLLSARRYPCIAADHGRIVEPWRRERHDEIRGSAIMERRVAVGARRSQPTRLICIGFDSWRQNSPTSFGERDKTFNRDVVCTSLVANGHAGVSTLGACLHSIDHLH